jgi:flagellar assembly protein FliH
VRAAQRGRLAEMQRVAVEVAVAVASHVLYERIESGDFPVEELVRAAVQRLDPRQAVTVRLHPEDLALLERRTAEEPLFALDTEELRLVADPALGRGDCRAETGDVAVMANLQEHLAEIRHDLLRALPEAEVERRKPAAERNLRRYPDRRATA